MIYDIDGNPIDTSVIGSIVGDGDADDTAALQYLVNTYSGLRFSSGLTIKLTSPISIDPAQLRLLDGGNSKFVTTGNFAAFSVTGALTAPGTGDPAGKDNLVNNEAGFTICNCVITSSSHNGIGISLSKTYKASIKNCYIYYTTTAIQMSDVHRDLNISGCILYAFSQSGILFDSTADVHQCSINNNMIQQGTYEICFDNPNEIANIQITGNDIEFGYYPTDNYSSQRGVYINAGNTKSGQLSEIEICGNTIQGHGRSATIIEILGGTQRKVAHVSICGNHISNSTSNIVVLSKAKAVSCVGNTSKDGAYVYSISESDAVTVVANTASNVTGIAAQSGTNTGIVIDNNSVVS